MRNLGTHDLRRVCRGNYSTIRASKATGPGPLLITAIQNLHRYRRLYESPAGTPVMKQIALGALSANQRLSVEEFAKELSDFFIAASTAPPTPRKPTVQV